MRVEAGGVWWVRAAAGRLVGSRMPMETAPDWAAVKEAARRHNLEPLLHDLVERGAVDAPDDLRETWERQYYKNQIFNLSLFELLGEVLSVARDGGAVPIVLKGPVAIARRLGDPGLRVMVDADLLCREAELATLVEAALGHGFQTVGENATYHLALQNPEHGVGLELHFDLYDVVADRLGFVDAVFAGAETVDLDGLDLRAPSRPADLVVQLAHLLEHDQRVDLRHWLDFAQAASEPLESHEAEELERLLALADLAPELAESRRIAFALFGVEGDAGAVARPQPLAAVEESLLDLEDTRPFMAGARMHSSWFERARYVSRLLFPAPGRWRALAASEGTGVGTALWRHLGRVLGRGRAKIPKRGSAASVSESPRARLFRRRERG